MTTLQFSKTQMYNDVKQIIHGSPAMPVSTLPQIWQRLAKSAAGTRLNETQRRDYVEAAQLFRYHETPLCMEALSTIGKDFLLNAYPDFELLLGEVRNDFSRQVILTVKMLFDEFGYSVPASFYNVIFEMVSEENPNVSLKMFKNKKMLMQDRLWDAVMHASLLVTPIGLYVQSIFSQHGLRLMHVMNCNCKIISCSDAAFCIELDSDLKPAYLQNMIAASFEQYGVNAATSKAGRGF